MVSLSSASSEGGNSRGRPGRFTCEMHSRGLPVSAGTVSGAEWSGVTEHPGPLQMQGWLARAGGGAGFLFTSVRESWS